MSNIQEGEFTVQVNNEKYLIEPVHTEETTIKFKVSTLCEYMFTLETDDNGSWKIADDVIPMDNELVQNIGNAIEEYDL